MGEYQQLAHAAIDEALAAGRTPIVVGGSGLYFRAALVDLELPPDVPAGERARWERLYDRFGGELLHALLAERDPAAAAQVHPNDRKRVVRSLELWSAGASLVPPSSRLWTDETRHPTTIVGLDVPRDVLDARIVARTRAMFEQGVVEEVRDAGEVVPQVLGLEAVRTLPREEAEEEVDPRHPPPRRLPAQVDAPDTRGGYGRRRGTFGRQGGGCDSRSGTRSATATCWSRSGLTPRPRDGCATCATASARTASST